MKEDKGRDHEDQPGSCSKQRGRKWRKPVDQLSKCVTSAQINTPAAPDRSCECLAIALTGVKKRAR